jgi:hypothetical protein
MVGLLGKDHIDDHAHVILHGAIAAERIAMRRHKVPVIVTILGGMREVRLGRGAYLHVNPGGSDEACRVIVVGNLPETLQRRKNSIVNGWRIHHDPDEWRKVVEAGEGLQHAVACLSNTGCSFLWGWACLSLIGIIGGIANVENRHMEEHAKTIMIV